MKKIITSLLLFFLLFNLQSQQLYVKNLTISNGLPSNDVFSAYQDKKGYIWFATSAGVSRYDGNEFKNYTTYDGLTDNTIFNFFEDYTGRIWFITFNARLCYFENEKIVSCKYNDIITKHAGNFTISNIYFDKQNCLWIAFRGKTLLKIDVQGKTDTIKFSGARHYVKVFDDNHFINGSIFYNNNNLLTINVENKTYTISVSSTNTAIYNLFNKINNNKFLFVCNNKVFTIENFSISDSITSNLMIVDILYKSNNNFWLGFHNGGVRHYYGKSNFNTFSFTENYSATTIEDSEGNIWICSQGNGVYFIPAGNFTYVETGNKFINQKIINFKNKLIIGQNNNTLLQLENNKLSDFNFKLPPNTNKVTDLFNVSDSSLWIASLNKEVSELVHIVNNKVEEKYNVTGNISEILYSEKQNIYFISSSHGLFVIKDKVISKFQKKNFRINSIFEDSKGIIWIGTLTGIMQFSDNTIKPFSIPELKDCRIEGFCEINGFIGIATKGAGIFFMKNNKIVRVSKEEGLASNFCNKIMVHKNKIYVSTNDGFSIITLTENDTPIATNYSLHNTNLADLIYDFTFYKDTLIIAGSNTIIKYSLKSFSENIPAPPLNLSAVEINNQNVPLQSIYHLNYSDKDIRIRYTGISFNNAGNVFYSYKMQGLDTNFKFTKERQIYYPILPPGKYKLTIYAHNNLKTKSKPIYVSFNISPPFYSTWYFQLFSILLILSIGYIILKQRIHKIQKEAALQKKLLETETSALRSQMNPHFIFNALSSIQRYILKNDTKLAEMYVSKFAKLIRLILDANKTGSVSLDNEILLLKHYLDIEKMRMENKFDYFINTNEINSLENIEIPSMILQPFLENAIWHGLAYKDSEGFIDIRFKQKEQWLICAIQDNGVGREKANEMMKELKKERRSYGLKITEERLVLLSGIKYQPIVFTDLYDENNNPAGTLVTITIKIL